jgi:hypothetical protein
MHFVMRQNLQQSMSLYFTYLAWEGNRHSAGGVGSTAWAVAGTTNDGSADINSTASNFFIASLFSIGQTVDTVFPTTIPTPLFLVKSIL